jgi:hypothetical protein
LPVAASIENDRTLPDFSASNEEVSFTAKRNRRSGLMARKLGFGVAAASPTGVSAPDRSSKRKA